MKIALVLLQLVAAALAAPTTIPAIPAIFWPAPAKENSTLVLLHVLFRHGNRAADSVSAFPNDNHKNETYEPYGLSQLTTKGKTTEYNIGKYLRSHYGDFIPALYKPEIVYSISTNFKRTKMSLESVLSSLFPPQNEYKLDGSLNWQPVPFNIEPGVGIIGAALMYCTSYITALYSYIISDEAQKILVDYRGLYENVEKLAGYEVTTPLNLGNVYFTWKSEEDFGLKLPEWSKNLYPQPLEEAVSVMYEFATANSQLKKLSAGFLLKKIIEDSLAKARGELPEERKLFVYSAHEYNVGTMLRALNVFYRHVPPFGATIYFEIHDIGGQYGLKLFYQDYKSDAPQLLTIPGCADTCPLDQLQELVKDSIPGPYDTCVPQGELL